VERRFYGLEDSGQRRSSPLERLLSRFSAFPRALEFQKAKVFLLEAFLNVSTSLISTIEWEMS